MSNVFAFLLILLGISGAEASYRTSAAKSLKTVSAENFENMGEAEISKFLERNRLTDPMTTLAQSPSFSTIPRTAELFFGVFKGKLETVAGHKSDFIPKGGLTLTLSFEGIASGDTYRGKQELFLFNGPRQVGHMSGKGDIRNIKTDPSRSANVFFTDSPQTPNCFQLFVSKSSGRIVGNFYDMSNKGKALRVGKIDLSRERGL